VIVGEAGHTRCVMGRLEPGEEVVSRLAELARFEKIDAGFVRAQGSVEDAELARWDPRARRWAPLAAVGGLAGACELASLQGNVSLLGGAPEVLVWAVLGTVVAGQPQVLAGRLLRARAVWVEFAVDVCDDADLERREDPVSGLPLWRPPRRR
jgi:predicted DNA-binding protein with PD1-like motif